MSKRPCQTLSVLFVFTFLSFSASPQPLRAQSAIGQLEQMTGQQIGRFHPSGMPGSSMGGMGGMGGMMMGLGLVSLMLNNLQSQPTVNQQQAAAKAQMEAWLKGEQQRLNRLVSQQRAKRDAEDKASMEQMSAAMSEKWDGGAPPSDLTSALSDPNVVVTNPTGTPFFGEGKGSAKMSDFEADPLKPPVDLSQRTGDYPVIPQGSPQATISAPKPSTSNRDLQIKISKKMQEIIASNQDPQKMIQQLKSLEEELSKELSRPTVADLKERNELMGKIARRLDKIEVPPPEVPKPLALKHDSLLILGTGDDQTFANGLMRQNWQDWEKRRAFKDIVAVGQEGFSKDLPRAIMDNKLAERSMLSEKTMSRLAALKDADIDHLVAHSNGATVAETLIRNDYIKVKEFTILGGDRSLNNLEGLKQLAYDKQIKIHIFFNEGDPVPGIPTTQQMQMLSWPSKMASEMTKRTLGIKPLGDNLVEVKMLPGTKYPGLEAHYLENYYKNLQNLFQKPMGNPSANFGGGQVTTAK